MRAPITDKHLLEMMWERFPEIMQRGAEHTEQEPVAWEVGVVNGVVTRRLAQPEPTDSMGMPTSCGKPLCSPGNHHSLCKLAEQPEQEPVAVHQFRLMYSANWYDGHPDPADGHGPYETRTLYISPPQRTWVGLTDEEIQTEWVLTPQNDKAEGIWFGRRIEAKLKEKNT